MNCPEISVVMSVYNGASKLKGSIESILTQKGVDLEFIIINDGSTDESTKILDEYATKDCRVKVIHQSNTGLTRALIRGCSESSGAFIARQDVGDISFPGRLKKELDLFKTRSDAVLVSCGTRFVGPENEFLFNVQQNNQDATRNLLVDDIKQLKGPSCHPCTMFRRDAYFIVGGYRGEFRQAQDIDLWVRLAEVGCHAIVNEILFQAEYSLNGISSGAWNTQKAYGEKILESARVRRQGHSDAEILAQISSMGRKCYAVSSKQVARAAYFIGTCLQQKNSVKAMEYYRTTLRENPLHLKALYRYICCRLGT